MKSIKPFEEFLKPISYVDNAIMYSDYIAENLDKARDYTMYLAENLDKPKDYSIHRSNNYGLQGYYGSSGNCGFSGPQGISGSSGNFGFSGPQGISGYCGTSGNFNGPQGPQTWINNYADAHQEKQLPVMLEDFHIIKNEKPSTLEDFFPQFHSLYE